MATTDMALDTIFRTTIWLIKHGYTQYLDESRRYTEVLTYYVSTGRLSGSEVRTMAHWDNRTISLVARLLYKLHSDTADYREVMEAVRKYL